MNKAIVSEIDKDLKAMFDHVILLEDQEQQADKKEDIQVLKNLCLMLVSDFKELVDSEDNVALK